MTDPVLVTQIRAGYVERAHHGRVAIVGPDGDLVFALGDVAAPMLPRSSCKILQALPMVESGAAAAMKLTPQRLALSCASHQGSHSHAALAADWLDEMGLGEADLECGPQPPNDETTFYDLKARDEAPSQLHNNCSGKHTGFLCQARHIGAPLDGYVDPAHPVQQRVAEATADLAGEDLSAHAIDGCSAPNFGVSLTGLARSMARIAVAETALTGARAAAAIALRQAMAAHPFEVAGDGRACTDLMRAGDGLVVKTGAEGAFTAILPDRGLGIALKINDGETRAAEIAMTSILVALGALDAAEPAVARWLSADLTNRRQIVCGETRADDVLGKLTLN